MGSYRRKRCSVGLTANVLTIFQTIDITITNNMNETPFVDIKTTTQTQSKLNRVREELPSLQQSSSFDETITELIEVANDSNGDINIPTKGCIDERD